MYVFKFCVRMYLVYSFVFNFFFFFTWKKKYIDQSRHMMNPFFFFLPLGCPPLPPSLLPRKERTKKKGSPPSSLYRVIRKGFRDKNVGNPKEDEMGEVNFPFSWFPGRPFSFLRFFFSLCAHRHRIFLIY